MDHFLEGDCELGKDCGSQLRGEMLPDALGISWHITSSASATEISSRTAANVSFVETLGRAGTRLVAARGIRNAIKPR